MSGIRSALLWGGIGSVRGLLGTMLLWRRRRLLLGLRLGQSVHAAPPALRVLLRVYF
jgi:hypothetical protein